MTARKSDSDGWYDPEYRSHRLIAQLREAGEYRRSDPADGWREGAEAMREACGIAVATWLEKRGPYGNDTRRASISLAAAIRALPIPSPPAKETKT